MTRTMMLLAALALASAAWAQAPAEKKAPEKPQAAAEQPQVVAEKPAAEPAPKVAKRSRRMEDARHCLQRPTNTEIIKCAEEYL